MKHAQNPFSNGIAAEFVNGSGLLKNIGAIGLRRILYVDVMKLCEQLRSLFSKSS